VDRLSLHRLKIKPVSLIAVSPVLTTEHLILRPVTMNDHAELLAHWTAPDVRQFLLDGETLSPAQIRQAVEDSERDFAMAGYGLWLVFETDPGPVIATADPVGTVGLRPLDDLGIEILYSLAAEARGKGYATEAARAVVDYALGVLGPGQVLAEVDAGNRASAAVVARLGMTPFEVVPGVLGPMTRYRVTG
jgi:[ribosomal protein S5]-alanine N-acetyltransferase